MHASESHLSKAELRERDVLRALVGRNRGPLTWYLVLALFNEFVHMFLPVAVGLVIDYGIVQGNLSLTVWATLAIIVVRLGANWAWSTMFIRMMEMRAREQHNLRLTVTAAALDPASKSTARPAGEVLSIATSDADRAPDIFDMLTWALPAAISIIGAGIWLVSMNVWVGLAVFASLGLQVVVLKVITPILSRKYDAQQSKAADAASTATDLVHGLRVLQGLGVQSRARALYRSRSRVALSAALVNARFSGLSDGLMQFTNALMIAAVVVISGLFTLNGHMSVGVFISAVGLARNLSGMMSGLAGVPVWWASFSTSARRIRHLLSEYGWSINDDHLQRRVGLATVNSLRGELESAAERERARGLGTVRTPILGEVSDGRVVAVVPRSAADAQAVLEDLRLLDSDGASVLIEPHAVDLFDGTLREQLATRSPAALSSAHGDDSWAYAALEAAGADDLLRILPDGLDTRIMDRGANLSGGQRQRLALARAVAADPALLVLHDPTTAVDAVTEQKIAQNLTAARRVEDRITVILTKAPALCQAADTVIAVFDGEPYAIGSHHDLMNDPEFAKVVQR